MVRIEERNWNRNTTVEVAGIIRLTGHREVRGIWLYEKNSPRIELNGYTIKVGAEGINAGYGKSYVHIRGGVITSSEANLILRSAIPHDARLDLNSIIADNGSRRVGIVMNGSARAGMTGLIALTGNSANTFTGDVVVEGRGNTLFLDKSAGVTAVRSNIYVRNGGRVAVSKNDQIADSSTVTLAGNEAMFSFVGTRMPVKEKVHKLVVQSGNGILNFQHFTDGKDRAKRLFYFDDLIIKDGASLVIRTWEAGRDHFLVRKDSQHLADALKKLMIDGWGKNQVYLKDYDKDYWSIEAAPEPSTYGTIFGVIGLGIFTWRRLYRMRRSF